MSMRRIKYILATSSEIEYLRKEKEARFRIRKYNTFEEVSEGLKLVLNYYSNNSWACNNDWAIHYFIVEYIPEQNYYKLITEGRSWLVPWKVYR